MTTSLVQAAPTLELAPELPSGKIFGHLADFRSDPLALMLHAQRTTGDLVRVRIGPSMGHLVSDPAHIKTILVDRHQHWSKQTRGYAALRKLLGNGLVTSEGSFWRRQRRIAQPAFHKRRLARLAQRMQDAAADLAAAWAQPAARGEVVDMAEAMMQVTLRIAGETLFSYDLSSNEAHEVGDAVTDLLAYFDHMFENPLPFAHLLPVESVRRGRRATELLDDVVYRIIEERRSEHAAGAAPKDDLLDMFMLVQDEDSGERMSDVQLRDEVVTMLTAGHETTANALSWTLLLLSRHPEVARRVQRELDTVLGGRLPSGGDVHQLRYLDQVLSESMRLYPPVWAIARAAEGDQTLGGYRIPAGSYAVMSPYVVHRHAAYWRNPEGFDPDRFSPDEVAARKARGVPRHAYLPFAAGPRKCIGDHFARMEALIILATLLSRYQPELESGYRVELEPSVTLRPRGGLPMRLVSRQR